MCHIEDIQAHDWEDAPSRCTSEHHEDAPVNSSTLDDDGRCPWCRLEEVQKVLVSLETQLRRGAVDLTRRGEYARAVREAVADLYDLQLELR